MEFIPAEVQSRNPVLWAWKNMEKKEIVYKYIYNLKNDIKNL